MAWSKGWKKVCFEVDSKVEVELLSKGCDAIILVVCWSDGLGSCLNWSEM